VQRSVQCSAVQRSAAQCSAVQCRAVRMFWGGQCAINPRRWAQHCTQALLRLSCWLQV
jgi:hypothetical protein